MKSIYKIISVAVICIITASFCYNNFFTSATVVGNYVNINHGGVPGLADIPYDLDTLKLYTGNKFKSDYWGKGTYKIITSITGTKIELTYRYQFGKGMIEASINRLNWGNPKIILDPSKNHYFEKLK